jgi:hypothetical protein
MYLKYALAVAAIVAATAPLLAAKEFHIVRGPVHRRGNGAIGDRDDHHQGR